MNKITFPREHPIMVLPIHANNICVSSPEPGLITPTLSRAPTCSPLQGLMQIICSKGLRFFVPGLIQNIIPKFFVGASLE